MVLVDTSVWVDFFKGKSECTESFTSSLSLMRQCFIRLLASARTIPCTIWSFDASFKKAADRIL